MNPAVLDAIRYGIGALVGVGCYHIGVQTQQNAINQALNNPNIKKFSGTCTKSSSSFTAEFYRNQTTQPVQLPYGVPQINDELLAALNELGRIQRYPSQQVKEIPKYYGMSYDEQTGELHRTEYY